jgi:hypothetical protein
MTSIPRRELILAGLLAATACGGGTTAAHASRPALPTRTSATVWVAPLPRCRRACGIQGNRCTRSELRTVNALLATGPFLSLSVRLP